MSTLDIPALFEVWFKLINTSFQIDTGLSSKEEIFRYNLI